MFSVKARIINKELPMFHQVLEIKNINFDTVTVRQGLEYKTLTMKDIELISENEYEEFVLKHKDILKIKLQSEISPELYTFLTDCIEIEAGEKLEHLEVLMDEFKLSKRGRWEKKLIVFVNGWLPLEISINALKYSKEFNITFKDISLASFIGGCSEGIKQIKNEIKEKEKSLERYKEVLKKMLDANVRAGEEYDRKLRLS